MRQREMGYELGLYYARASDDGYRSAPLVIREQVRMESNFFKERLKDADQKADD